MTDYNNPTDTSYVFYSHPNDCSTPESKCIVDTSFISFTDAWSKIVVWFDSEMEDWPGDR